MFSTLYRSLKSTTTLAKTKTVAMRSGDIKQKLVKTSESDNVDTTLRVLGIVGATIGSGVGAVAGIRKSKKYDSVETTGANMFVPMVKYGVIGGVVGVVSPAAIGVGVCGVLVVTSLYTVIAALGLIGKTINSVFK